MADVDRVYANLPRRYQKVYKQICEGYFSDATLAYESLRPLQKDIKSYGSPPLRFLFEAARALIDIQTSPLFINTINWGEENKQIRELKSTYSQKFRSDQRGMDLAEIACKETLQRLKNSETVNENIYHELVCRYIQRIYDSNFADRIPLSEDHYLGRGSEELCSRLNGMRSYVDNGIEFFASQVERTRRVGHLRLPSRPNKKQTVDILDDDIFTLE